MKDCYLCNFNRNIVHLLVLLNKYEKVYLFPRVRWVFLWITVAESQHFTTSFSAALPYQI